MKKIDLKNIDRKKGIEAIDFFRDGRSSDLDSVKVSSILKILSENINDLINEYEVLKIIVMKTYEKKKVKNKKRGRPKLTNKK